MAVIALVDKHLAHTEECLELMKRSGALRALRHHEPVAHLVASPVAVSAPSSTLVDGPDREATFSVYKTNNPT